MFEPVLNASIHLFNALAQTVKTRFKVATVQIWRLHADGLHLFVSAGAELAPFQITEISYPQVLTSSELVVVRSTKQNDAPIQFYAGTPLRGQLGEPAIGTLCISSHGSVAFSQADLLLFEAIGVVIAALLNHLEQPGETDAMALSSRKSIVVLDAEHNVRAVNDRFTQLTGFAAADLQNTVIDHLLCLDRPHTGALLLRHALLAGLSACDVTRCRTKNGSTIPVETFVFPVLDADDEVSKVLLLLAPQFSGSIEDFLLSLRESERTELLSQHIDGLWATNAEGQITELSGKLLQIGGDFSPANLLGKRFDDIELFDRTVTDWSAFYDALARHDRPPVVECCTHVSGATLWYQMRGFRQGSAAGLKPRYHGSFRDITQSKHAQQMVLDSERKFKELTALSSDWYWAMDAQHRFVTVGEQFQALTGLAPQDVIGKARWELESYLVSAAQWSAHKAVLDARIEFRDFEVQKRVAGGATSWASMSGIPRFAAGGQFIGYHGVGRDITQRKSQEEYLQKSRERLSLILEGTSDGAWDWDIVTGECFLSPRWWQMMGLEDAALPVTPQLWMQFIHVDDRAQVQAAFSHAVTHGLNAYQGEFRMLHKDGHFVPVLGRGRILRDVQGKAVRTAGTNVDLTDVYRTKQKLDHAEARFKSLAALSSDWYWEQDANFRFIEIQAGPDVIANLSLLDAIGKKRWELPILNVTKEGWKAHRKILDTHQSFSDFSLEWIDTQRHYRWALVSGEPIFKADGQFVGYRGVSKDITRRKLQEHSLQESQLRLKLVLDGSTDGAWDIDLQANTHYLSSRGWHILGYREDELKFDSSLLRKLTHPEDFPIIENSITGVLSGGDDTFSVEIRMFNKKGHTVLVLYRGKAVRDASGRVVRMSGTITDQTQQHQSQAQIRLLESCVQSLQDVVLITHASPSQYPGPLIAYVNNAFEEFTGYSRAEVIGKTPRILQGLETSRLELERIANAMRLWQPVRAELANYKKNGEVFWIELQITPVAAGHDDYFTHWIGVQRDITSRKQAEQVLENTANHLSMVLQASDLGTWVANQRDRTTYRDARWFEMLGYKADYAASKAFSWHALVHPDDRPLVLAQESSMPLESDEPFEKEFRMLHRDGRWRWIHSYGKVISRDEKGNPVSVAGTHMDITDKVNARQLASRKQSQLVQCLEAMHVGVLVSQNGTIRFANRAMLQMLDIQVTELPAGRMFKEFIEETDHCSLDGRGDLIHSGQEAPSLWLNFKRRNGAGFRALLHCSALEWNDEKHTLHTVSQVGDANILAAEVASVKSRYERLLVNQLEEKQAHIARELHDSLGSQLAGISLQAAAIKMHNVSGLSLTNNIERLLANVKTAAELTRGLARGLVPVDP